MAIDLEKNFLIKANPGTGKTTALAERVIELLKNGVKEKDILCLTFTNKAVDEMVEKINRKITEKGPQNVKINEITISTFHSFCSNYFTEMGIEYELISNNFTRFSIFKSLERNNAFNYEFDYIVHELVPKIENSIRYIKSFGITPDAIDVKNVKDMLISSSFLENLNGITVDEILAFFDYFISAFKDYEMDKGENRIDYNDLLKDFLIRYDPTKKHYKYVLVDELQDLNGIEAEIAKSLGDYLFLVGDRKQSIFGFQGGSLKNFLNFEGLKNLEQSTKGLNYRSYGEILEYSKEYFLKKTKDDSYKNELEDFKSNKGKGGSVKLIISGNPDNLAIKLAIEMVSNGKKAAIITRTNDQIISISKILDAKNIEYATTASASVSTRAKDAIIDYLKGIFYRDENDIIKAMFTPFSGISLREAFEIEEKYRKKEMNMEDMKRRAKPLFEKIGSVMDMYTLNQLFNSNILPIAMALDKDYYITAAAVLENINQYFDSTEIPRFDDLLIYLYAAEDSYESNNEEKNLILTTVHKAKGLEFENVIYLPKKPNNKTSFIDLITNVIIRESKGIDVKEELSEENIRVDFVAFTRAKDSLSIVTNSILGEEYYMEGFIEKAIEEVEDEPEPYQKRYAEAYSLFVNKRYDDAKKVLEEKDTWLVDRIKNYFQNELKKVSFSMVTSLYDPLNFIKTDILRVKEESESLRFGKRAHELAEKYFKNEIKEEELNETDKKILQNITNISQEITRKYGAAEIDAEKTIEIPVDTVFPDIKSDLNFTGKLDAIYLNKDKDRFLIIDFKTDKADEDGARHRRQLSVYRRLFSIEKGIKEKDIDTAIAYINLTGKINTGKFEYKLDTQKIKDTQIETFKTHLLELISFKENPILFIEKALEKHYYTDNLSEEISMKLKEQYRKT